MITSLLAKILASAILRKVGKALVLSLAEQYVDSTDNKVDDKLFKDLKKALD